MRAILAVLIALGPAPLAAQAMPGTPLSAPELADLRGGFVLPGGMTITLGVTTDTRIDGREVLRTVFAIDRGMPQLTVSTRAGAETLKAVSVEPGGAGVTVSDGVVRVRSVGEATRVEFAGDAIDVAHLVGGGAIGSVIANTANNRTIDVATAVDIGLGGIRPDQVGGALARVDSLAIDVTTRLIR